MFKYILLCSLLAHTIWAKPVHQHHSELAPHVLIVTPQAQLRLESLVPGTPIIQHLSPLTRYIAPHEETIVYVPASAAAAIQNAEILSRSYEGVKGKQINPIEVASAIGAAAASGAQSIQGAAQSAAESASSSLSSLSSFVPSVSNPSGNIQSIAEGIIQGAQSAANSFAQASQSQQSEAQTQQPAAETKILSAEAPLFAREVALPTIVTEQKLPLISAAISLPPLASSEPKLYSLGAKIPSLSPLLQPILPSISIYSNEPRHHYVVAPAAPHVVDFVPTSVLLSPATQTTIKARRSILGDNKDDKDDGKDGKPLTLATSNPALYAANNDLEKEDLLLKEKKEEFKRFLAASAPEEEIKDEQNGLQAAKQSSLPENEKDEKKPIEPKPLLDAANENEEELPSTKEA